MTTDKICPGYKAAQIMSNTIKAPEIWECDREACQVWWLCKGVDIEKVIDLLEKIRSILFKLNLKT